MAALALGVAAGVALWHADAHAEVFSGPCASLMDPNNAPSTDPRVDHLVVGGVHVNVLVPPRYRGGGFWNEFRRYPVLYLFHGAFSDEDSFTTQTDLISFTSGLDEDDQAIIVMPDGGHLPAGRDWVDGTHHQETFVINTLLPYIDATYRTVPDRAFRAAAGFSAGGMNALVFASRHPELFAAVGSFSGFDDPYDPNGVGVVMQFAQLDAALCGATVDPLGIWGDPSVHPMGWIGHDPRYLVAGLKNISVYAASANGVPCADDPNPDPFTEFAEGVVYAMTQNLDAALTAGGVAHTTRFRSCGVHVFSNANQDLREFWPQMQEAFWHRPPSEFDLAVGDATGSAWGWTFAADAGRAAEFLTVHDASASGVQLTGSGVASVTTAPLFARHQRVRVGVDGGPSQSVRADDAGRLTFSVNLGTDHSLEEYTPAELAAESANPRYFTTRSVHFRGSDGDDGGRDD